MKNIFAPLLTNTKFILARPSCHYAICFLLVHSVGYYNVVNELYEYIENHKSRFCNQAPLFRILKLYFVTFVLEFKILTFILCLLQK